MDIDGTLLDSTTQLPAENLSAIAEAAERGIEILLVTGRRFDFARAVSDVLPCDLHLIVSNGALIKSKTGETHQRLLLPSAVARRVVEAMPQFRAEAAVVFDRPGEKQVFLERIDWRIRSAARYFRRNSQHIGEIAPLTDCFNGEDPIQVGFVGRCEPIRAAKSALQELPFTSEFTMSLTEYEERDLSILDVMRQGVTKGFALAEWAQRRGIRREEVMAIGDNWNDREMLEYAGFPVMMGNSRSGVEITGLDGYPLQRRKRRSRSDTNLRAGWSGSNPMKRPSDNLCGSGGGCDCRLLGAPAARADYAVLRSGLAPAHHRV